MMAELLKRVILVEGLLREWVREQRQHSHCLPCGCRGDETVPGLGHAHDCLMVRTLAALADEQETKVVEVGEGYRIIITSTKRWVENRYSAAHHWAVASPVDTAIVLAAYDAGRRERDE